MPFAIYKYAAPTGLGNSPLVLNSMAAGQLGLSKNDFPDTLSRRCGRAQAPWDREVARENPPVPTKFELLPWPNT